VFFLRAKSLKAGEDLRRKKYLFQSLFFHNYFLLLRPEIHKIFKK